MSRAGDYGEMVERLQRNGVLTRRDVETIVGADRDDLIWGFLVVLSERVNLRATIRDQQAMLLKLQSARKGVRSSNGVKAPDPVHDLRAALIRSRAENRKLRAQAEAVPDIEGMTADEELEEVEAPPLTEEGTPDA
jgi:hypothetical protein